MILHDQLLIVVSKINLSPGSISIEASPMEEELWIDQTEALQLRAPHEGTTLSPLNLQYKEKVKEQLE